MSLTSQQRKQIHDALLDGFDQVGFERLVTHHLDTTLDTVARNRDLSATITALVAWADRHRCVLDLIDAACAENPHNHALQALRADAASWRIEPPEEGDPPYQGLRFFDVADAPRFFGREQTVAELVRYLRDHAFLAVIGASGSGKSSVVRAGLVPALQLGQALPDGTVPPKGYADWPVHIVTPTAHPLTALSASLTAHSESVTAQATLMDDLAVEPRTLNLYTSRLLAAGTGDRLLLVVDQFEELFTLCQEVDERRAFVDNLLIAAEQGSVTVVLTLRADFYHRCAEFDNLRLAVQDRQIYIGAMSGDQLRRAIEEPAEREGWDFEEGLVDLLLDDVAGEPGALPLLSHALLETWKRRSGRTLTLAGYLAAGGVRGAIARTADDLFAHELSGEERAIRRTIFLNLTELGEGGPDTRRRVARATLLSTDRPDSVEAALRTLAEARLITTDRDQRTGLDEVEVAHETLIREWPTLQSWLAEDREALRVQRQLINDAEAWQRLDRDYGHLYRGTRLEQAQKWATQRTDEIRELERQFLAASRADAVLGATCTVVVETVERMLREDAALHDTYRHVWTQIIGDPDRRLQDRVQAGDALAVVGDQRPGVGVKNGLPDIDWVAVEPGPFIIGEDRSGPSYKRLKQAYRISRYPVTVAQYRAFVEAGGYWNRRNWTDAGWIWRFGNDIIAPETHGDVFQTPNHPQVGVNWYEAVAFCAWLSEALGYPVSLPSEPEWEKAARGTDGRTYPWGDEGEVAQHCNMRNSGIGSTSTVGIFPSGGSPTGCLDMAGNVWEWTRSVFKEYPYDPADGREEPEADGRRTVRGGSCGSGARFVRCARRPYWNPDDRSNRCGFRLQTPGSDR